MARALGGYDEMVFRAMIRDDSYIYNVVGLESEGTTVDFQTGANAYLYGTRFMNYLALRYGPDKLMEWITRKDGTKRYFASQFERVYGVPLATEWRNWIAAERQWQQENLRVIRQYPLDRTGASDQSYPRVRLSSLVRSGQSQDLRGSALSRPDGTYRLDRRTDRGRRTPQGSEGIGALLRYLARVSIPKVQRIFFTTDNNNWRDLNVYDLRSRHSRLIVRDVRTGDLAWNAADGSLWGIRHNNGLSSVIRFAEPFDKPASLFEFPYGS